MPEILFIQGGGHDGYQVDKQLVSSLQKALKKEYTIHYPEIASDPFSPAYGWVEQIEAHISAMKSPFILLGHSFGASMILKYLSEHTLERPVNGIFLLSTPLWGGDEDWKQDLKLKENYDKKLPAEIPMFFYHCLDDEEVAVSHFHAYKQKLTHATFRVLKTGGHMLDNDLSILVQDIKSLENGR
jgi:predicted alpha/beta hydrolase family esterase